MNFVFLAEFTITVRNETLNFYSTTENADDILQIRCHNLVNGIPVTTRERFRLTDFMQKGNLVTKWSVTGG